MTIDQNEQLRRRLAETNARVKAEQAEVDRLQLAKTARENAERWRQQQIERQHHERRMAWREAENYSADWSRTEGIFARYQSADPEQREMIESAIERLMPRLAGPEDDRRSPPRYAALSLDAKLITLGAFLGIDAARDLYPRLLLNPADWMENRFVYEHPAGPADLGLWRSHLPQIREHIDAGLDIKSEFTVERVRDASHVVLRRHPPLPQKLDLAPDWHRPDRLALGTDVISRDPVRLPLDQVEHIIVGGATGYGKSNALGLMVRSYLANVESCHRIILCDGKMGIAFSRFAKIHPKVQVITEVDAFRTMLAGLVRLIDTRNAALAESGQDNSADYIPLVIDEIATFTRPTGDDAEAKRRDKKLLADLYYVCEKGRSAGVRIVVTSQAINDDMVPVRVRNACTTKVAFRLEIASHVHQLFGSVDNLPAPPAGLRKGQAILRTNDIECLVQFPLIPPGPVVLPLVSPPTSTPIPPPAKPAPPPPTPLSPRPTSQQSAELVRRALIGDPTPSPRPQPARDEPPPPPIPGSTTSAPPVCKLHYQTLSAPAARKDRP